MDRVRFGRALGYGARHAAKTLMQAADAASTPSSARPAARPSAAQPSSAASSQPQTARVAPTPRTAAATAKQTAKQTAKLGRSVWTPLARFSSVVWLQVTGLFFALLAMFLGQGAWKERAAMKLPLGTHAAQRFYVMAAVFLVFAYFSVSNFVRAALKDRR